MDWTTRLENEFPLEAFFGNTKLLRKFENSELRIGSSGRGIEAPAFSQYDRLRSFRINGDQLYLEFEKESLRINIANQIVQPAVSTVAKVDRVEKVRSQFEAFPLTKGPGRYFLFRGLPGSGKSTAASLLADSKKVIHIDFAAIAHYTHKSWIHRQESFELIGDIVAQIITDLLRKGYDILHDTTSITDAMTKFHLDRVDPDFEKTVVRFTTTSEVCRSRLAAIRPLRSPDPRPGIGRAHEKFVMTFDDYLASESYHLKTDDYFEIGDDSMLNSFREKKGI